MFAHVSVRQPGHNIFVLMETAPGPQVCMSLPQCVGHNTDFCWSPVHLPEELFPKSVFLGKTADRSQRPCKVRCSLLSSFSST